MSTDTFVKGVKRVPDWVWGTLLTAALSLSAWAHGILWDHEKRIGENETRRDIGDGDVQEIKDDFRRMREELRQDMKDSEQRILNEIRRQGN